MIDVEMAQNFIQKMQRQIDVQINIMNEKGIIIASSSPERVGDFHQQAYDMILKRQQVGVTERLDEGISLYGVKQPGINLLLQDGSEICGVLGLSGSPAENEKLARLIKFFLETLLESDSRQRSALKEQQANNKLCDALLREEPINPSRINRLAKERGLQNHVLRVPILLLIGGEYTNDLAERIISAYMNSAERQAQDLFLPADPTHLFLLRSVKKFDPAYFEEDLKSFFQWMDQLIESLHAIKGLKISYFYSPPEEEFTSYRICFQNLKWLSRQVGGSGDRICSFRRHLAGYLFGQVPAEHQDMVFHKYADALREHMDEEVFLTTMKALVISNMNLTEAAELLFIHKNTLNARIKKMKTCLGIDPFFNIMDAIFLVGLYYYVGRGKR